MEIDTNQILRVIDFATKSSSISGILRKTHKNINLRIVTLVKAKTIAIKDWFLNMITKVHNQVGRGPIQIRNMSMIVHKATPYDLENNFVK